MKKIVISALIIASIGLLTMSFKSAEVGDPTAGYSLTFHPSGIPSDEIGIFGIRLWERGNPDNMTPGSSRSRKYDGTCQFVGICNDQNIICPPNDPNYSLVGREVKMYLTNKDIANGYKYLYYTQSINNLDENYRTMYINYDVPFEGTSYKIVAGDYQYDPTIGQFGGYKLVIQ